ncbi:MAG: MlaD family protein, partial [Raineya sp.]|nr:MlaD family protein [Raineya sp.]
MKLKISNEFKVGVLGLISLTLLYLGFNFLKGKDFFAASHYYYALYDDVQGLAPASLVKVNGVAIGRVLDVRFLQTPQNPKLNGKVLVTIDLNEKINMGKNTIALIDKDLLGGTSIDLKLDYKEPFLHYDDTLKTGIKKSLLSSVQDQASPVLAKVDSIMLKINAILSDFEGLGKNVKSTLQTFEKTAQTLESTIAENRTNLLGITTNFKQISQELTQTTKQLPEIAKKLDTFADSLQRIHFNKTLDKAEKTLVELQTLLAKLNQGEGTLGLLFKDQTLYENLTKTSAELTKLLIDLRQKPQRY